MSAVNKPVRAFIDETGADEIIRSIEQGILDANGGNRPAYSDLIVQDGDSQFEYVNYVQEGGGVLGIALIGYTYALEKMGFRFLRLAGTSAGSITTILLASVDKKNYPELKLNLQSEIMLHELLSYDLWKLVDGHWLARRLIRIFINYRFGSKLLKLLILASILVPIMYAVYMLIIQMTAAEPVVSTTSSIVHGGFSLLTLISMIILAIFAGIFIYFRFRFSRAGFGINPGRTFHEWITSILVKNQVNNLADLESAMQERYKDICLRPERAARNIPGDDQQIPTPLLTLVASDITAQTKVEFPLMAGDYWENPASVNPADFARASMSIPIFFEPFRVQVPESVEQHSKIRQLKASIRGQTKEKYRTSLFVDGGILSNFPINVFHNPAIPVARLPTFGVKLEDEEHRTGRETGSKTNSLLRYLGDVFSTVRFYYDRDFLKRNAVYEQCIGYIDAAGYNWLNFGMNERAKKALFLKGVEAARTFFLGGTVWVDGKKRTVKPFNWEKFKTDRTAIPKI